MRSTVAITIMSYLNQQVEKKKEGKQCSPPKDSFLQEPEVHHMAQTFTIVRFELRKSVNGSREEVTHLMIIFEEMVNKTC